MYINTKTDKATLEFVLVIYVAVFNNIDSLKLSFAILSAIPKEPKKSPVKNSQVKENDAAFCRMELECVSKV